MSNSFFNILRAKTSIKPNSEFDHNFWRQFEKEFGKIPSQEPSGISVMLRALFSMPAMAAAASVLIISGILVSHRQQTTQPSSQVVAQNAVEGEIDMDAAESTLLAATEPALLNNMDVYLAFDDITQISDEDWNLLLSAKSESAFNHGKMKFEDAFADPTGMPNLEGGEDENT